MSQKMPNSSSGGSSSSTGNKARPIPRNRFQKSGSEAVYEVSETKEACVMRVDMPGCQVSDFVHWVADNNVHFFADEPAMPEYNHDGRKYGGSMMFNPETYNVKDSKVKLLNGVLWIVVPKIPGKNAKIDIVEEMIYFKI